MMYIFLKLIFGFDFFCLNFLYVNIVDLMFNEEGRLVIVIGCFYKDCCIDIILCDI